MYSLKKLISKIAMYDLGLKIPVRGLGQITHSAHLGEIPPDLLLLLKLAANTECLPDIYRYRRKESLRITNHEIDHPGKSNHEGNHNGYYFGNKC